MDTQELMRSYKMLLNAGTSLAQLALIAKDHRQRITQRINAGENTPELHEARAFLKKKINLWAGIVYREARIDPSIFYTDGLSDSVSQSGRDALKLLLAMTEANYADTDSISLT